MRPLIAICCLIFITTVGITYAIVEESDAPFIYYFSPTERAIIIERADGADRWTLMKEMFASERYSIQDLRWSPSGEWLLWTVRDFDASKNLFVGARSWALRYDLSELRDITSLPYRVPMGIGGSASWSPKEDQYLYTSSHLNQRFVSVIDFETQEIVFTSPIPSGAQQIKWSQQGDFLWYLDYQDRDSELIRLATLSLNGDHTSRQIRTLNQNNQFFLDGTHLVYLHPYRSTIIVEDVLTLEFIEIGEAQPPLRSVSWSPDGDKAVIFTESTQFGNDRYLDYSQALLFSWQAKSLTQVVDTLMLQYTFAWTPTSESFMLHLGYAYSGERIFYHIQESGENISFQEKFLFPDYDVKVHWAEDGRYGFLDTYNQSWIYDVETHDLYPNLVRADYNLSSWSPNDEYLATLFMQQDFQTHTWKPGKSITERLTGNSHHFPSHTSTATGFHYQSSTDIWHKQSEWVLFREQDWSGYEYFYYSIAHISGIHYREISGQFGYNYPTWVPNNVPLDDLH